MKDYEVEISDLEISDFEERVTTRSDIVKEINRIIKRDMKMSKTLKGIEIDVKPEWEDLLLKDGSIIRSYEKAGWKVRWWNIHEDGPALGRLLRSWLCIQDAQFVQDTTKQKRVK
jgi:hypothetical protein